MRLLRQRGGNEELICFSGRGYLSLLTPPDQSADFLDIEKQVHYDGDVHS